MEKNGFDVRAILAGEAPKDAAVTVNRSRTPWSFLREVAHLRPRTNVIGAATRVRHTLAQHFRPRGH